MLNLGVGVTFDERRVRAFSVGVKSTNHNTKRLIDGQAKAITQTGIDFNGGSDYRVTPIRTSLGHYCSDCEIRKEYRKYEMSGL